jgi:hypothetical protein
MLFCQFRSSKPLIPANPIWRNFKVCYALYCCFSIKATHPVSQKFSIWHVLSAFEAMLIVHYPNGTNRSALCRCQNKSKKDSKVITDRHDNTWFQMDLLQNLCRRLSFCLSGGDWESFMEVKFSNLALTDSLSPIEIQSRRLQVKVPNHGLTDSLSPLEIIWGYEEANLDHQIRHRIGRQLFWGI